MAIQEKATRGRPRDTVIRVNVGGEAYRDRRGRLWDRDRAYSPGSWGTLDMARTDVLTTKDAIAGTADEMLFQSIRVGEQLRYRFDLLNGTYRVHLLFAEIYWESAEAERQDVFIQGRPGLTNFSIFDEAGHDAALEKQFPAKVNNGRLEIAFVGRSLPMHSGARVCAIEISRATRARKG